MLDRTPSRNLAMELVRVTEAAALSAARFMGRGDKKAGDQAAVDGMRLVLNTVEMDGIIVIGEGEKDHAPMLYNGEKLGTGDPPQVDIAVDPIDGTRPLAEGRVNDLHRRTSSAWRNVQPRPLCVYEQDRGGSSCKRRYKRRGFGGRKPT